MITLFGILDLRFMITFWYLRFTVFDYPFGILDLRFMITLFDILDLRFTITLLVS